MGEVAVADRDLRTLHQEAIDGGQQAAEQGAGRYEADGSSLGHCCPFLRGTEAFRLVILHQAMYARCQRQLFCLHGSN